MTQRNSIFGSYMLSLDAIKSHLLHFQNLGATKFSHFVCLTILPPWVKVGAVPSGRQAQNKVGYFIICFYSVFVVNNLSRFKSPSQLLLHCKSVLQNISHLCRVWVRWIVDVFIPLADNIPSTPFRISTPNFGSIITFGGTELQSLRGGGQIHFTAGLADSFNRHNLMLDFVRYQVKQ